MLKNARFIKVDMPYLKDRNGPSPLFRRVFTLKNKPKKATLHMAALGYGYFYLNGQAVTSDLFLAPVADYTKTVWYTSHDVSALLKEGENILAVECGNGWYNEYVKSAWDHNEAPWRDNPKLILSLFADDEEILVSDEQFKCSLNSPVTYNQLRLGEHFDSRLYQEGWNTLGFDDSDWMPAILDDTPPRGTLRPCLCQPIRECEEFAPVSVKQTGPFRYTYDFGQNMSGYAEIFVNQPAGDCLTLHYTENCDSEGHVFIYKKEFDSMYPDHRHRVQKDEFICCGKPFRWKPKFTYHGFRYLEIEGLREPCEVKAIFVHQDMKQRSRFSCSNEMLNRLFRCGIYATYSNFFYMPTDCPTREKLGWCNDAQSSCEQFLTNFEAAPVLEKWLQDIYDAMREDGMLPGIVPSSGWGYEWGNGPVSEGILYEVPYRIWLHTGNREPLIRSIPYFERHLAHLDRAEKEGEIRYGLDDWAALFGPKVSAPFINAALQIKFHRIALLAKDFAGEDSAALSAKISALITRFKEKYIEPSGRCRVHKQTAVAMILVLKLYEDVAPLKAQLKELIEENGFHHDCGMVGLRYLYEALNLSDLQEYAYKVITVKGIPGYDAWLQNGATTLYEYWDHKHSKNHHMYSDFMSWLIKTPLGLTDTFEGITIDPFFIKDLDFVEGQLDHVALKWERKESGIALSITIGEGSPAIYHGKPLEKGTHKFIIKE